MAHVFVSYSRPDAAWAERLAQVLASRGYDVWWDRRVPPGETWDRFVGRALKESACVVVLWSSTSVTSDFVKEEALVAKGRGVLVPVRVEDVHPPLGFSLIEGADLWNWAGDPADPELIALLDAVETRVRGAREAGHDPDAGFSPGPSFDATADRDAKTPAAADRDEANYAAPAPLRIVAVPAGSPHDPAVDVVLVETDTELVLGAPKTAVAAELEPLEAHEYDGSAGPEREVGSVLLIPGDPVRIHLVVHALERDPTCTPDVVRSTVQRGLVAADAEGLQVVRVPLIGVITGALATSVSAEILKEVLARGAWRSLRQVHVVVGADVPIGSLAPLMSYGLDVTLLGRAT